MLTYGLASKGYNLTVFATDIETHNLSNLHYIHIENVYDVLYSDAIFDLFAMGKEPIYKSLPSQYEFIFLACEAAYISNGFQQLINYPRNFKFDLIIYDNVFGPCLLSLVDRFNHPPLIAATAFFGYESAVDVVMDALVFPLNQHNLSKQYYPNSFLSRLFNFFNFFIERSYRYFIFNSRIANLVEMHYGKSVDVFEIETHVELVLLNTDKSLDIPQTMAANVIAVGGLQIQDTKPLPKVSNILNAIVIIIPTVFHFRTWKIYSTNLRKE